MMIQKRMILINNKSNNFIVNKNKMNTTVKQLHDDGIHLAAQNVEAKYKAQNPVPPNQI